MSAGSSARRRTRQLLTGLLFASPWILGLLMFDVYPIGISFYYSLTSFSVLTPPVWVGLDNYVKLITRDETFLVSVSNSLAYAAMLLPSSMIVGVGLALLLNTNIRGVSIYRAFYYLPVLVPPVASAVIWKWVLNPRFGVVNVLLGSLGLPQPGWLSDPLWAKPSMVMIDLWALGNAVVIYLAGLQDVPRELLEAAEIDGAGGLQRTWYITLPMITPVIFFNLIMGVIGAFQAFTVPFTLTNGEGSPAQSLLFYSMYLFRNAFMTLRMGTASAMAWMLLAVVLVATLIIFGTSSRWVYYRGGEKVA
jgi:multiple sugar transport system permease protein